MLTAMGAVRRARERLVLSHVHRDLAPGEGILAWSHANVPDTSAPAVLVVTDRRCLLRIARADVEDIDLPLHRLELFEVDRHGPAAARVRLLSDDDDVVAEFSLISRARSRAMGRVLAALHGADVASSRHFDPTVTSPLQPLPRGVRGHARRVWLTVLGVLVLLLSLVFASPFVPGPGALTAVAGIAILAKEYEWARDLHVWAARQADRFVAWLRGLRVRRRDRRAVTNVRPISDPVVAEPAEVVTPMAQRDAS
jgi:uncharacterized protein (TIGR02611 family)